MILTSCWIITLFSKRPVINREIKKSTYIRAVTSGQYHMIVCFHDELIRKLIKKYI